MFGQEKMKISVRNLTFSYTEEKLFENFCADLECEERPLVILGPSGCGKTTLLKLLAGLLKPQSGDICFFTEETDTGIETPGTAFIFQETRLLPWLTVLENVSLPLKKIFGREEAQERARHFLSLVSLEEKAQAFPGELSGGQAQRVSMARAFAWPSPALFMDEPFQFLDIPLRISLMETCLSLLAKENFSGKNRFLIAVTHDPREAVYMGGRIIFLGKPGEGIVFDRRVALSPNDRVYGSKAAVELEKEIMATMNVMVDVL
jgi:NitT/TauT family transport system ATP-binding protein